jgi:hypothetical protein
MRPPGNDNDCWDLVAFVIIILALATVFAFAGQKIDELRQGYTAPQQEEARP